MFTRIIRHDLRLLAADRSLALVASLFTLLLAYAMWNGAGAARARERAIGEAARRGGGPRHPAATGD